MAESYLPTRDLDGIRIAVLELLEEDMTSEEQKRAVHRVWQACAAEADPMKLIDEALAMSASERTLPAGYYEWAGYLMWLSRAREIRLDRPLTADEFEGLMVLQHARSQFEHEHPPCPECGARYQTRFTPRCDCKRRARRSA